MKGFRWKKGELDKLDKDIKKFNKRINELKKKGFDESVLPSKMNYYKVVEEAIKNKDYTRKDIQEQFKLIEILLDKKNEKEVKSTRGLVLPLFAKKEAELKIKAINREREKERKRLEKLPLTDRNVELPDYNKDQRDLNVNKIRDKKFNWKNMSNKDFEMFKKTLYEYDETIMEKQAKYRENFYKAMFNKLTLEHYQQLKEMVDKIPTEQLIDKYYTDLNMDIEFFYDNLEYDMKASEIIESWNSFTKEKGY